MAGRLVALNPILGGGEGLTDENLPPPSTLAAQLVRNHVESARGLSLPDTASFRQLLQEILNKASAPETDVEINHKLIKVVIEAGLDVLFHDTPFAQWNFLLPQALDSLAVIQSTLERQPEILFLGGSQPSLGPQRPHLLLWLFPKLLEISRHPKSNDLQHALASLLSSLISSLSKSLELWPHVKALLHTIRDCITDVFSLLRDTRSFSKIPKGENRVLLPPSRSLSYAWPKTANDTASTPDHQLSVNDAVSSIRIQLFLLSTLRAIASAGSALARSQTATFPIHKWVFDSIAPLTRILLQHRPWLEQHDFFSLLALQVIRLQNLLLQNSLDSAILNRTPYLLSNICDCCAKLIICEPNTTFDDEMQQELALIVEAIIIRFRVGHERIIEESLLPSFRTFARKSSSENSHESLRRVIDDYLSKFDPHDHVLGSDKPNIHNEQPDVVMEDDMVQPGLQVSLPQKHSQSATRSRRQLYLKPRIPRLRNIGAGNAQNWPQDSYHMIVQKIARLLGRTDGTGGGDIHSNAP